MAPRKKLPDTESKKPLRHGDRLIRDFLTYYAEKIPDQQIPVRTNEERVEAASRALIGGKDGPNSKTDGLHLKAIHAMIKADRKLLPQTAAMRYASSFKGKLPKGETSVEQMADRLAKAYRKFGSDFEAVDFKFVVEDYIVEYDANRIAKLSQKLDELLYNNIF